MNIKQILLVLALFVSAQPGFVFGGEERAQTTQSWAQWVKSKAAQAWSGTKNQTQVASAKKNIQVRTAASTIDRDLVFKAGMPWAYPALRLELPKLFAHYRNKEMTRKAAIDEVKFLISLQLSDRLTYPTKLTILHALLKKNEFLVGGMNDIDGIVEQACSELSEQIAAIKFPNDQLGMQERQKEEQLDREINKLAMKLKQKEIEFYKLMVVGGEEKINTQDPLVKNMLFKDQLEGIEEADSNGYLKLIQSPEFLAIYSVYQRLKKQMLVDAHYPGIKEQTSSVKFYKPIIQKEAARTGKPLHKEGG